MNKLKPCPFCGGRAETHDEVVVNPCIDHRNGAYIDADVSYFERTGCPACDIWFELADDEPEGLTVERWNRRAES